MLISFLFKNTKFIAIVSEWALTLFLHCTFHFLLDGVCLLKKRSILRNQKEIKHFNSRGVIVGKCGLPPLDVYALLLKPLFLGIVSDLVR